MCCFVRERQRRGAASRGACAKTACGSLPTTPTPAESMPWRVRPAAPARPPCCAMSCSACCADIESPPAAAAVQLALMSVSCMHNRKHQLASRPSSCTAQQARHATRKQEQPPDQAGLLCVRVLGTPGCSCSCTTAAPACLHVQRAELGQRDGAAVVAVVQPHHLWVGASKASCGVRMRGELCSTRAAIVAVLQSRHTPRRVRQQVDTAAPCQDGYVPQAVMKAARLATAPTCEQACRLKLRPPSAMARCSSWALIDPVRSVSIACEGGARVLGGRGGCRGRQASGARHSGRPGGSRPGWDTGLRCLTANHCCICCSSCAIGLLLLQVLVRSDTSCRDRKGQGGWRRRRCRRAAAAAAARVCARSPWGVWIAFCVIGKAFARACCRVGGWMPET